MRALERALETDVALSERQVVRHYGASLEDCLAAGFIVHSARIAPTVHRKATRAVNFVMLEPHDLEGFELRHLAGVAAVRHQVCADPRDWQVVRHADHTSPDAIWHRGLETWAVEFDAGAYSRAVLLEKAQSFRAGFDAQVWGVASSARATTLRTILRESPMVVFPF